MSPGARGDLPRTQGEEGGWRGKSSTGRSWPADSTEQTTPRSNESLEWGDKNRQQELIRGADRGEPRPRAAKIKAQRLTSNGRRSIRTIRRGSRRERRNSERWREGKKERGEEDPKRKKKKRSTPEPAKVDRRSGVNGQLKKKRNDGGKTRGRQKKQRGSRGSRMRRQRSREPNHGPSPLVGMLPDWPVDTSSLLLPLSSSSPSNPPMEFFHDCHPPRKWWGIDMIPACDSTARPPPQ
ncbi:uncharacterized protein BO80DRAFT_263716 [Aspergillus ibericus CBS 121593]|uniref:Uncharacterized protein n=1 Tax=Aspergillus ibericus CBS 121593 TaxID=1448316 RepID=A0A395GIY0_9EURO|nr:hypothetical protein BO80DRAFT_263716 [Aspergillus ibericus CBS 121593]RAK95430.1 hypothetical protein BO80DRAFT_263716 [Aspergillus ibericus CBS 121593]